MRGDGPAPPRVALGELVAYGRATETSDPEERRAVMVLVFRSVRATLAMAGIVWAELPRRRREGVIAMMRRQVWPPASHTEARYAIYSAPRMQPGEAEERVRLARMLEPPEERLALRQRPERALRRPPRNFY